MSQAKLSLNQVFSRDLIEPLFKLKLGYNEFSQVKLELDLIFPNIEIYIGNICAHLSLTKLRRGTT